MFMPEPLLFIITLVNSAAILFVLVYFQIIFSDLECDYMNAQQCCSKLNPWVLPKLFAHIFLIFLLLSNGSWVLVIFNLPVAIWLLYDLWKVPQGNVGVYDPTEIHNRGQLSRYMRHCWIWIGFYLTFFFVYVYCLMNSLLKVNPIKRQVDNEIMDEHF